MELLEKTIGEIVPPDAAAMQLARERLLRLTMPRWALGKICDLAVRLSGITGRMPPPVERRVIVTMAGDHGVVEEGVSLHQSEVTSQMVANMVSRGAGVNVLAELNRASIVVADFGMAAPYRDLVGSGIVLDMSVGKGTANIAKEPAMTREQARRSVENGIRVAQDFAAGTDVFGTGEMGIGNTTPATAIASCLTGLPVAGLTGSGTGLDAEGVRHKIRVIEQALAVNRPAARDALDILSKVGGFEIGGIAGLILGAASRRKPVLVDGFISTAGAMLARVLCPGAMSYAILAHASAEPGHRAMCEWLGQTPVFDLNMRLGEGTGAAMALNVVDAAARILTQMATFDGAGVTARAVE